MEWAKGHVDRLRDAVGELADGELHPIETWREYEPERSVVVYRVGSKPKVPKNAGLIVGDAVQNFRSCLNYAAWQLAIDDLGREPNDAEAHSVQFPIVSLGKGHAWPKHPHRKFMSEDAARVIKEFQPFHIEKPATPETRANLRVLADLSNDDKHKVLQVAVLAPHKVQWRVPADTPDCTLADGSYEVPNMFVADAGELHEGDEVAWIRVVPTGPNPDVDLQPVLAGKAMLGQPPEAWELISVLDGIGVTCARVLGALDPLMK